MHIFGRRRASTSGHLVISSNTATYNVFTSAGSPSVRSTVSVTVNSGITVGSLDTGTWPAGSVVKLINNGLLSGTAADAVILGRNLTIDNTNGVIGTTGSAFKAVALHGHGVTWIGGNNSSQVRGVVS